MIDDINLNKQIYSMIHKSNRSLKAAKQLYKTKDYDFSSSRAYYAAFYAIEAILLTKKLTPATHSGVIRAFNLHFIKTKIFPKDFSKLISRLFRDRQIGDYEFDIDVSPDSALNDINDAKIIIDSIVNYLKEINLLS